jgi:hypothetical protein
MKDKPAGFQFRIRRQQNFFHYLHVKIDRTGRILITGLRVASVNVEGNCKIEMSAQKGYMSHLEGHKAVKQPVRIITTARLQNLTMLLKLTATMKFIVVVVVAGDGAGFKHETQMELTLAGIAGLCIMGMKLTLAALLWLFRYCYTASIRCLY